MKHKGMSSLLFRLVSIVLVIGMLTMGMASSVVAAGGSPSITTDKTKYTLGETMVISGIGFTAGGTVNIEVLRPDHEIDLLPSVTTDGAGSFQTSYTPPIIPGRYKITATDGTDTAKTAATEADAVNFDLIAFGVKTNAAGTLVTEIGWGRGNSDKGWREGDWVPVKLVMTGVQSSYPNLVGFPDIYIGFDFTSNSDCRFVDLVRGIQVGTVDLTDAQGWPQASGSPYDTGTGSAPWPDLADVHIAQTSVGENTWTGFTLITDQCLVNYPYGPTDSTYGPRPGAVDDGKHQFVIDADVIKGIVSPTASTIVVYFQAHLSRTFVWLHSLQSEYNTSPTDDWGGSLYGDPIYATDKREGSSFAPGSSGHMYVNMVGVGQITCQLPIPPKPAGVISGLKWHDLNANHVMDPGEPELSGWTMRISGTDPEGLTFSVDVLTGDTDGDGIVDDVNSGAYSFPDLTEGIWYIGEMEDRDVPPSIGWNQTYPYQVVSVGIAVSAPTVGFPAEFPPAGIAGWGWVVNITETNISQSGLNFGNVGIGCLTITKQLSIPAGVPLGPLDGTFIINVANVTFGFSQNLTFTMTDGVVSGPQTINNLMPGIYTLTELGLPSYWAPTAGLGSVTVNSGAGCAARTVTNTYTPGCLTITKELSIPVGVPLGLLDGTFVINVANVTFGFSQNLTFTMTDGVVSGPQTVYNLIPGIYTLTEPSLPSYWAPTAGLGDVTVSSSGTCAARTVTNTYTPGCLTITKALSIPGGVPLGPLDGTFIINVANVTFGFSQNLTFTMTDGVVSGPQTINNLIPGIYTLTEPGLPSYWAATAGLGDVTVGSGTPCAARTVINSFQTGCLEIVKSVDLSEVEGPIGNIPDVNFIITVTGPSY
ncbi:MAG: hypothetical protein MUO80_05915, partial [Dehalococcoidia bacterium]|nr:hypothetical protein [Dehalococcoidia bacterium]